MTSRRQLLSLAVTSALLATTGFARAQEKFPSKPISMVTHAGPGGGTDITTRMMMVSAPQHIGQELTVVSKTGGSGTVALQYAMSQPKDGHTVLTITQSHLFQILQGKVNMQIEDLVGVARATLDPQVIAVKSDSPIKNIDDLIQASKAKQGGLKWGTTHVGGIDHVSIHLFTKAAGGIPYAVVAFRGGGDIVINLVGGNLDVALLNYAEGEAQFKAGQIRAIAVLDEKRMDSLKGVPTATEQGVRNTAYTVRGFAVLKGTPEDRIAHLEKGMIEAMKHPVYQAYLTQGGMSLDSVAGSADWTKMIRQMADDARLALTELGVLKK